MHIKNIILYNILNYNTIKNKDNDEDSASFNNEKTHKVNCLQICVTKFS